jgi:hypothetical protein
MRDALLIITPLLVLGVVLLAGFAGCDVVFGLTDPPPEPPVPPTTLTFKARLPNALTPTPGVQFAWTRPGMAEEEPVSVDTFTQDGADKVYEYSIPMPAAGMGWLGRCIMTVDEGGQTATASSPTCMFDLPDGVDSVFSFQAKGSPSTPPFAIDCGVRSQ